MVGYNAYMHKRGILMYSKSGFGFPVLTSQLLSAPPSAVQAFAILLGGYLTDRYNNKRGIVMASGFAIGAFGFLLLKILEDRWGKC